MVAKPIVPDELLEQIIDIVAGAAPNFLTGYHDHDKTASDVLAFLLACAVACQACLPRCRYYLFGNIAIKTPQMRSKFQNLVEESQPWGPVMYVRGLFVKCGLQDDITADRPFLEAVSKLTSLQSLEFRGTNYIWGDLSGKVFGPLVHLHDLTLVDCSFVQRDLWRILQSCPRLIQLRLRFVTISDWENADEIELPAEPTHRIEYLDVGAGCARVVDWFVRGYLDPSALRTLYIDTEGYRPFVRVARQLLCQVGPSLKTLSLALPEDANEFDFFRNELDLSPLTHLETIKFDALEHEALSCIVPLLSRVRPEYLTEVSIRSFFMTNSRQCTENCTRAVERCLLQFPRLRRLTSRVWPGSEADNSSFFQQKFVELVQSGVKVEVGGDEESFRPVSLSDSVDLPTSRRS
ncbi:hypothetical protein JAAARDRAFT_321826 [Jaapia argillacea MUCL 33604]|uniref:F-box domain-containing protein n=1 Tax=Jaapia argillacea MUCL 33604 TaxID=933084 RepID=A0A067PMW2_9AGAM|nr:hypothetical protein JAAARDRAFT_321826 [Jaapia argillacea MUCL 33604]